MAKKTRLTKKQKKRMGRDMGKLMGEYKDTGKMKTSRAEYEPEDEEAAAKQAAAIEYGKMDEENEENEEKKGKRRVPKSKGDSGSKHNSPSPSRPRANFHTQCS
jgi:Sec-independent protein translocase protein TatA